LGFKWLSKAILSFSQARRCLLVQHFVQNTLIPILILIQPVNSGLYRGQVGEEQCVKPVYRQWLPLAVCARAGKLRALTAFGAALISVITKTDDVDIDY
jgi:hypothetical protein